VRWLAIRIGYREQHCRDNLKPRLYRFECSQAQGKKVKTFLSEQVCKIFWLPTHFLAQCFALPLSKKKERRKKRVVRNFSA
jgi:hypothetical protein